ncbi:hypothetical protein OPS25_01290 [Alteromonas ponticola]|uniref:DUF2974 domain-containing protein n=1 Tax=Alteromonas aquimaris TaxID=2998417 RepID=A0ABT3P2Z5_9ALTE|nr:hypothetical protein [Alteromonas aquimaris]MCW8107137.1 hypothetical protein [Alteromonas aquimaris]
MRFVVILMTSVLAGCATNNQGVNHCEKLYCYSLADYWEQDPAGFDRARAFANKTAIYAVYSANVYDKPEAEQKEIFLPTNEYNREILHYKGIDTETGFRAKAWLRYRYGKEQSEDPILVFAFRGTDNFPDWIAGNLRMFNSSSNDQFKSAKKYKRLVLRYLYEHNLSFSKIIFTGHSLGGGLAEFMQTITPNSEAIVFMSSPNNGYIYSFTDYDIRGELNSLRVYEKGEILNALRLISTPDFDYDEWPDAQDNIKTAWINFFTWTLLADHGIHDFTMQLLQAAEAEGNCSAQSVINKINQAYNAKIKLRMNETNRARCSAGDYETENKVYSGR